MSLQPRSYLFVPGSRPERFDKACASGADAVIIDLEDAVGPENKTTAREQMRQWFEAGNSAYVRINAANTKWFADDCTLLSLPGVVGVMLPKAQDFAAVERVNQVKHNDCQLLLLIETAAGLLAAPTLAALTGVSRLAFGSVDFQLDCSIPDDGVGLDFARSSLVVASAAAGLPPPIDGVTTDLDDQAVLLAESKKGKKLGFGAKLCIHPKQIKAVNSCFAPTAEQVQQAQRIVDAAKQAGSGDAARLDGKLLEKPIVAWAERVLAVSAQYD